jgi:RNA polymerase sigma-70 factor (ECF subfamily)
MGESQRASRGDGGGAAAPPPSAADLERYRQYLTTLARARVAPGRRDPVDVSGVVQQTFLEAHQQLPQFRGNTSGQLAAWLRSILARNLADALRGLAAAKRGGGQQRSLEQELEQSSDRLAAVLAATEQSSPSLRLCREERAAALADALARLPEAQREALVLQHWHGWTLDQIAAHLERSPAAVAGLLHRGLKRLRADLWDVDGRVEP